jgi:hypothetical protein
MFFLPVFFLFFFVPVITCSSIRLGATIVRPPPEKGMNLVHLVELFAYLTSMPYITIIFLALWCINMTWGIVLVLEHCGVGPKAFSAGTVTLAGSVISYN